MTEVNEAPAEEPSERSMQNSGEAIDRSAGEKEISKEERAQELPLVPWAPPEADETQFIELPERDLTETQAMQSPAGQDLTGTTPMDGSFSQDEIVTRPMEARPARDLTGTQAMDDGGELPAFLAKRMSATSPSEEKTPPARSGQATPASPLPKPVSEVDLDATRVSPAAYANSTPKASPVDRPHTAASLPRTPKPSPAQPEAGKGRSASPRPPGVGSQLYPQGQAPVTPRQAPPPGRTSSRAAPARIAPPPAARAIQPKKKGLDFGKALGCVLRLAFAGLFILVSTLLCIFTLLFYQYYRIASTLPNIDDLRQRASQFETTRILDRNGNLLYEIIDPTAGYRTYVPLSKISPNLVAATIATEDKGFYSHPGFDVTAIVRAFVQNYQSGETVSGASTITQQLARTLLFTPEERSEQSYQRKVREAILASEITRRYTKDEILELYLNEIYYGNMAYGIQAAAETYFGGSAEQLTLGQAAFLAGLPQAPSVYDVYINPEATFTRQEDVLVLMYELSQEQGCIYVSNNPERICVDPLDVSAASDEIRAYQFQQNEARMRYPHWVTYVRSLLEQQFDAQTIYRSGFTVYTTLDPELQDLAQAAIQEQVQALRGQNVKSGAVVILRPSTGEILSMVGSADFYDEEIDGQVNMAINPRQPGSAIKPLTYLAAFEKGWTPATLIWDVPSEFTPSGQPDDPSPLYVPENYDGRFHGPVTVRWALGNSYNIPAVKTLQFVGIYDDPNQPGESGLINMAKRMGITTLQRPDYGLSLTLGGGEVTLLELTSAYATIANSGWRVPPVAITRILDYEGKVIFDYQTPTGEQVLRPEHAYLMSSILADNQARTPAFGADSVLRLPFPAAAKTGTTNDFRDNWTLGYTPDVTVGVWVGNADFTPMQNTSGLSGAAPIWAQVMTAAEQKVSGGNQTPFTRPAGIVERVICKISGTEPSQWCPEQSSEIFTADQPPLPADQDLWQKVVVDTWTGLRASPYCPDYFDEQFVLNVSDQWARKWIRKDPEGQAWAERIGFPRPLIFAPTRECGPTDPRPNIQFVGPRDRETIWGNPLDIYAVVEGGGVFESWRLEYGLGENPVDWEPLAVGQQPVSQPGVIYTWDLTDVPSGILSVRLSMTSTEGTHAERHILLNIQVPTPTPTPTPTWTPTPTPTLTLIPSETPTPTFPVPSETPTPTSGP